MAMIVGVYGPLVDRCADRLRAAGYRYPDEMAQWLVRAGLSAETSAGGLATEEEWARSMDSVLNSTAPTGFR